MNWLRVDIDLEGLDPAPFEQALTELGAVATTLSDAADDRSSASGILEPAPGATPIWPLVKLSALFAESVDETRIRLAVAGATDGPELPAMQFETVAEQDWIADWQQSLKPLRAGPGLWICPTGTPCPEPGARVVELDPGLAFGTGEHPTTALCLEWLAASPAPVGSLLDYGCGSGILGIAALRLGAEQVVSVDLDEQALRATHENAERNGVLAGLTVCTPERARQHGPFDRIVANILSGTLIELAAELRGFCRAGTCLAMTGILTHQAHSVQDAYTDWVDFRTPVQRGDWILLTGTVKAE